MISVIIPAYNIEKYLEDCLKSVLSQSFTDLEIIVVNDGSTDSTPQIAEKYALTDPRIRVIHRENGGLSSARNVGLDAAKGEWIMFVDSDDILLPGAIETLYTKAVSLDIDILCGRFVRTLPPPNIKRIQTVLYDKDKALENVLYQKKLDNAAWAKIYKRIVFENLRYNEGLIYEDLEIICPLIAKADKVGWTNQPVYYYRPTPGSLIKVFNPKRFDVLKVTEIIEDWVQKNAPDLKQAARSRRLSANFNILGLIATNNSLDLYGEIADKCWDFIKKNRWEALLNPKVRFKNKMGVLISFLGRKVLTRTLSRHYEIDD